MNKPKQVSELLLVQGQRLNNRQPSAPLSEPETRHSRNSITRKSTEFAFAVWLAMGKVFGSRWVHKHGTSPSSEWITALDTVGDIGLQTALRRIGELKPNAAGEIWPPEMIDFLAMCRPSPEELGLPDLDTAYRHACVSNWSHPVVYEAAKRIGTFEIRSMPESKSRPLFERTYRAVCAEILAGATFEVPKRAAIEHKQDGYIGDEKFNAMRDDYRKGRSLPAVASLYRVSLCDAWSICENGKRVGEA